MEKTNTQTKPTAVITTGSKQYVVKVGDVLNIETLTVNSGEKITLDDMLTGNKVTLVASDVVKGPKISIWKFKNKTRYTKRMGHRQKYLSVKVESIA